jgi:type I restriction enzyme S subunit
MTDDSVAGQGVDGSYELPPGWVWTTLGEIAELIGGGTPSRERPEYFGGDIVWLTPTEIPKDRVATVTESKERITQDGLRRSSARLVPKGSVLMTSRASIGYVAIAGAEVTTNQGFASFITSGAVYNSFLAYWLWSQRDGFIQQATGTTFKEITKSKLRPIAFPLAPLPEQHRIVAKIEELLTSLDAGGASLKRIQAALKRYRAAVLKAACEGRLVPQDPNDEPAEKLLERILVERRAKWEADLRAKGKHPKKAKYEEPKGPDAEGLPELPEGWYWAKAEQLCDFITKGTTPKSNKLYSEEGEVPFIKVYNLTNRGVLDFSVNPTFISAVTHKKELARSVVYPGDVLMNIVGPPLGKVSIAPETYPEWNINQAIAIFRPKPGYNRRFLAFCLLSDDILSWATRRAKATAGQFNLTLEICRALPLPVPPEREQHRIVAEIERRLSVANEIAASVEANLVRSGRLRQAILRRAFEGKLVA